VNRTTVRCRSVVQGLARARCWNRDAGLVRLAYDARGGGGQLSQLAAPYDSSGEGARAMGNEMQKIVPPLPETLLLRN
jgi:hypothetical protein